MQKTILITGATDGIGLETAKLLAADGHHLLLHGRSLEKLSAAQAIISDIATGGEIETVQADFSRLADVEAMAQTILETRERIDVLINNAGVLKVPHPITGDGFDVRFAVNTLAPYLLTRRLLAIIPGDGRVINLSSAAQDRVDLAALRGERQLDDMSAYSQSKLALTMWTRHLARELGESGPVIVAVNPGSLLGSKMVKEGFGTQGKDLGIGADILRRAALSNEFADASGKYFDNDAGRFSDPHPDAMDEGKCAEIVRVIEKLVAR